MSAKNFCYVCAGVFLLALAHHLGAKRAEAQANSMVTGIAAYGFNDHVLYVMTPNGDIYQGFINRNNPGGPCAFLPATFLCNFWTGAGAVQVDGKTWGAVKDSYRK